MCVASKFKHIYFGWSKKTAKCYALNLNFPRPLNIAVPICDRHLFCDLLRICLRCPGCVQLNIEFEWTKFAKRNMKNKRLSMFSNKNRTQIHLLKNMWVFVRFFFTLEIFSFIDNPNNPFRWLVKIAFFCFMLVLLLLLFVFFIDDVCDVVTNTTDKGKRNAQVFAWKKSLSSPKRKYCLICDYMSVQCKCVACIFRSFSRRIECFFFFLLVMNTFIIWRYSIVALLTIKRRKTIEIDNMSFFVRERVCALSMDVWLLIRKTNAFIYFFIEDDEQTPRHARQVLSLL